MNKYITVFFIILLSSVFYACDDDKDNPIQEEKFNIDFSKLVIRDPFIFADPETEMYYIHICGGNHTKGYRSKDLKMWSYQGKSFEGKPDFWGKSDYWAPDLYHYKGKYYLFVTFSSVYGIRGTSIMTSDNPLGPFEPLVNEPITPTGWQTLDASLYIDKDNTPWLLFAREWLEVGDGEIYAQQLSDDLKATVGDPIYLFKASDAPWTNGWKDENGRDCYVTDAPFIHRMDDGKLVMLWSSNGKNGKYCIGAAYSESGSVSGPWVHETDALNNDDGGHAMIFKDFEGNWKISYHSPNSNMEMVSERVTIKSVSFNGGKLTIVNDLQ